LVHLVSYANSKFSTARQWLRHSAQQVGITQQHHFSDRLFSQTSFYQQHRHIAAEPFGAGFYLWKPYYILQVLQQLPEGELLLYIDSGQVLVADPAPLLALARQQPVVLFENYQGYHFFSSSGLPFTQEHCYRTVNHVRYWCKADCLQLMNAYHDEQVLSSMMVDASILVLRKCDASLDFVQQWLLYCTDRRCISWDDNQLGLPNHPGFIMHIYDQSVISILAAQQGISLYRCPSQYGNHLKPLPYRRPYEYCLLPYHMPLNHSPYDTITHHHRYKEGGAWWRWKKHLYREAVIFNARRLRYRLPFINSWLSVPVHKLFP
jgi:hypothetical protein